jgi:hypothetical protein
MMKQRLPYLPCLPSCFIRWAALLLVPFLIGTGCAQLGIEELILRPTQTPSPEPVIIPTVAPTPSPEPVIIPTVAPTPSPESGVETPLAPSSAQEAVLYEDNFADPTSGWPKQLVFDKFYIGYHEPEYYHVEVHAANARTVVAVPEQSFDDFVAEAELFVSQENTAPSGDFRYGLVVRRAGEQYYGFTISPHTKRWFVLKSSPSGVKVLAEGTEDSIQGLEGADTLRVDAKGPDFSFHINGRLVSQVKDADYVSGEVGFFVQTFDSPRAHIHYDSLVMREFAAPPPPQAVLYEDNFADPTSGWPKQLVFDKFYIGYHEPEYYHVEVHAANARTVVAVPEQSFDDFVAEAELFVSQENTAPSGDFRYGLVVRRAGEQYYGFTISPHTKRWFVLKSSPSGVKVLAEGTEDSIQGLEGADTLRVDAKGPDFSFHINGRLVSQVKDADYVSGEVGFFVQTFDSPRAHIHYDSLVIREPVQMR